VMAPIFALSIYALAIIIYKAVQFVRVGLFQTVFVEARLQQVRRGELRAAQAELKKETNPIARVMDAAIDCLKNRNMSAKSREAEIARVGTAEIRGLESHLRGLEMVYTTAPLIGLLGTVLGMVTAFSTLASAGARVDPTILASGIWQALVTTVGGLCVAIPAVAAYYFFDGVIERIRATMRDASVQILALQDLIARNELPEESTKMAQQSLFVEQQDPPVAHAVAEIPDTVASHVMVEKIAEYPPMQETLELTEAQMVPEQPTETAAAMPASQPEAAVASPVQKQKTLTLVEKKTVDMPLLNAVSEKKKRAPRKPASSPSRRAPASAKPSQAVQEPAMLSSAPAAAHAAASNARLKLLSPTYNRF
jgi:biopolymer transport protein ExbB